METGHWRSTDASKTQTREPEFNFEAIQSLVQLSTWEDDAWRDYFQINELGPLAVEYEELAEAPLKVALRILDYLEIPAPEHATTQVWEHQRQADAISDEWAARYRSLAAAAASACASGKNSGH